MLKKTVTYENPFTEEEVTEVHYFHISKADMIKLEMSEHKRRYTGTDGKEYTGWMAKLQRIVDSEDGRGIMEELEDILRRSYGRKDGDFFRKSPEILANFEDSGAFGQVLFELCTSADIAADFVNQVFPKNLEQVAAEVAALAKAEETKSEDTPTETADISEERQKRLERLKSLEDSEAKPDADAERRSVIFKATPQDPVTLTRAEMLEMDNGQLQRGLTDGRYKLS